MTLRFRLPGLRQDAAQVDPGLAHPFQEISDPGLAAAASGGASPSGFGPASPVAMTDNFMRKMRCGVPGCGRDRHDPIHEPAAD